MPLYSSYSWALLEVNFLLHVMLIWIRTPVELIPPGNMLTTLILTTPAISSNLQLT
jgi:hypothetical protein